jgi:GDPmannose 4,6-dehydratase
LDSLEHVSSNPALRRPTDIPVSRANTAKAQQGLGWKARHRIDDVVRMMVEGFRG